MGDLAHGSRSRRALIWWLAATRGRYAALRGTEGGPASFRLAKSTNEHDSASRPHLTRRNRPEPSDLLCQPCVADLARVPRLSCGLTRLGWSVPMFPSASWPTAAVRFHTKELGLGREKNERKFGQMVLRFPRSFAFALYRGKSRTQSIS
jgi:hypothetical protein